MDFITLGASHLDRNISLVSGSPSVFITAPPFDGGVGTGDVNVSVIVKNFTITKPENRANLPGEGHIIFYKDVIPPVSPGFPAVTGEGTYKVTNLTHMTWHWVSQNTHTFSVQLVNNDNTPLLPPIIDAVDVTAYSSLP
jgi:hypothetical protein